MSSWLQRHRKQELLDLSEEAGLHLPQDLRKDEIVEELENYLQQNSTRLSQNATFDPYYGTRRTPFKPRTSSATGGAITSDDGDVKSVVRGRGRRATKVKQEFDSDAQPHSSPVASASSTALATTSHSTATTSATALPRRTPGRPRTNPLPPSPADVADLAEYESTQFFAGLNDAYSVSGIPQAITSVRDYCSSVAGIQLTFLLLEAFALQREVVPWLYLFEISGVRGFGWPRIAVYYPDLFVLLTSDFWYPTLMWATTSLAIPALVAYFYNLTLRDVRRHGATVTVARYTVDPLMFNVAKAIVTYVIYGDLPGIYNWHFLTSPTVALRVRNAMFGGYHGVLTGCGVTALASLYEAAQRR